MKVPLHSNVHWGMAYGMLARCYDLQIVCSFYHYYQLANYKNSQSIYSSAWQMNFSAQLHLFDIQEVLSNTSPGQLLVSRHPIGNMSTTRVPLYHVQMISNKSSHTIINQPSGMQFLHLKSSRQHGRRSATPPDTGSSRVQSTLHLQKYRNITTSLTTRRSTSSHFVRFFTL